MQFELFREEYRLREKISTRARSIRIEIRPGPEVLLVCPRFVARSEALNFLRSREDWIRRKIEQLAQQHIPLVAPARWDGSDEIFLRGVRHGVQVVPASVRRISLRLDAQQITLFCPPALRTQAPALERALKRELRQQALLDARRYLESEAQRLGVSFRQLRINDPRTLWGSCNPSGTICLSWRLVMAPPPVFHYVAVHELCHLVQRNHSARFWALVRRQLPDYEEHKRWLREHGASLHQHLK